MMVMFLQLDNINLERLCLLFTQLVRERHQEAQEQHRTEDIHMLSPTSAVIEDYLSDLEAYLKTLNHADLNSSQLKKNLA